MPHLTKIIFFIVLLLSSLNSYGQTINFDCRLDDGRKMASMVVDSKKMKMVWNNDDKNQSYKITIFNENYISAYLANNSYLVNEIFAIDRGNGELTHVIVALVEDKNKIISETTHGVCKPII